MNDSIVTPNASFHGNESATADDYSSDAYPPLSEQDRLYLDVSDYVTIYGNLTLAGIGIPVNLFTVYVMARKLVRVSTAAPNFSTILYIIVLAVSDALLLVFGALALGLGRAYGLNAYDLNLYACRAGIYGLYTTSAVSMWMICVIAIERTIVVYRPLSVGRCCSTARTGLAICAALVAFLCAFYSVALWGFGMGEYGCTPLPAFNWYIHDVHVYIDSFIYAYGPITILLVCNAAILWRLRAARNFRKRGASGQKSADQKHSSLTSMLTIVSVVAFLLITPTSLYLNFTSFSQHDVRYIVPLDILLSTICDWLIFLNSTLNFFLYVISGSQFRADVRDSLPGCGFVTLMMAAASKQNKSTTTPPGDPSMRSKAEA